MVVSVKMIQLIQWTIWSGVMVQFQIPNTPSQTQNTSSQYQMHHPKYKEIMMPSFSHEIADIFSWRQQSRHFRESGRLARARFYWIPIPFHSGGSQVDGCPLLYGCPRVDGWPSGGCKAFEEKLSRECTIRLSTLLFLSGSRTPLQKQIHPIRTLFHWKWNENEMKVK